MALEGHCQPQPGSRDRAGRVKFRWWTDEQNGKVKTTFRRVFAMPLPANVKPYTVSKITQDLKAWIEEKFTEVWVGGEVSGFKHHAATGHMYVSLKDEGSVIPCAVFRGSNLRLRFTPQDGHKVVVRGEISVYEVRGGYQIIVHEM